MVWGGKNGFAGMMRVWSSLGAWLVCEGAMGIECMRVVVASNGVNIETPGEDDF